MKREFICGICILAAGTMLGAPLSARAAEVIQESVSESEELLTAGVSEIFTDSLT